MKKLILLFTLILGISVAANAQAKPAEFKFDKETFDFGMIPANKPAIVDFKFTNTGDEPLIISKVETSCGCTVPEYTQTPVKKVDQVLLRLHTTQQAHCLLTNLLRFCLMRKPRQKCFT